MNFLSLFRYNEVCAYNWGKGGFEPQTAHFMQVIWKGSTELGIGKAQGKKNGRRYTYIVARYRPAISLDTSSNVLKGKFNSSYCGRNSASSLSDSGQNKRYPKLKGNPARRLSKQPRFSPDGVLLGQTKQPIGRISVKETRNPARNDTPKHAKYGRKTNLTITQTYPHRQGYQNDKLSYYAGNSWGANQESRMPILSSEYYPKQAEVLEEFVEGDDPAEKAKYEQAVNNDYNDENGENGGFTQTLIPLMNSEDAEIDDDSSEDEIATKSHVPKHTN